MKTTGAALSLLLLLAGCGPSLRISRPPSSGVVLASSSPYPTIRTGIDTLLADSLFPPSMLGIKVFSLDSNETLYELNAQDLFTPASNQKLFTSAAALALLGGSFPLRTVVYADSLSSRLLIKGFGDPLLTRADLDSLARAAASRMPVRKRWTLGYDVSHFDGETWGAGWAWDDEPSAFQAHITPLVLDFNTVEVSVAPGLKPGDTLRVRVDETARAFGVENSGETVADSARIPLDISRRWKEHSNRVTVSGQMKTTDTWTTTRIGIREPDRYAAAVFAASLGRLGVAIDTVVQDSVQDSFAELARYCHSVDSAVVVLNKESNNLVAEVLLKVLGAEKRGLPGTAPNGISAIREFLSARGIDTAKCVIADGSGISRYNLISPSILVDLLAVMHREKNLFPRFAASLPRAGVDGTLANRLKGTAAEGNLLAKTGTETGVTTLSGYVRTADGELLAFSIMMQNFPVTVGRYRAVQDRIGAFLAGLRRRSF
jgi:D-alanyl-D-alanine carboxypeptidase/D-alanyl-D-alanine-endopeptidase (penicillin-binding protein 4)